ncbi:Anucleate primary sterigmata protein B [Madurella mycetomatis]|uniref:Anucleate primary sterigmata protein B n=1 Tax=Madurella mycetomatis TaxID=100816 RepID=A0A175VT35_9PEZI|nr:Anucleate primary sterigmata protein B [Madurella mycetomatis]
MVTPALVLPDSGSLDESTMELKHSDSQAALTVRQHLQDIESSFSMPPSPIPAAKNGTGPDLVDFDTPSTTAAAARAVSQTLSSIPFRLSQTSLAPTSHHESNNEAPDSAQQSVRALPTIRDTDDHVLETPTKQPKTIPALTDTVIARHVRDVHVPESLASEYKSKGGLVTPARLSISDATNRLGKSLTLREQSNTIERLSKENFDLKLKVMFLSDRLDKLSEESVKHMISENVELKSSFAVLQRDNKILRRRVKELSRQLKDEDDRPGTAKSTQSDDDQSATGYQQAQEEIIYLREQLEEHITEIERLKTESLNKEAEKRRMAEVVRTLGERAGERMGESFERQEEADVWKDLLEQETARREQADEDNRRLREEIFRLKQEMSAPGASFSSEPDATVTMSVSSTLVDELRRESEQLRHENAELRREVGAQTSMLTSRNREKERLYQEIEDLKMAQRRGVAAPSTVDSILERSASRAGGRDRSHSRASAGTLVTGTVLDDAERDELENKIAEFRDKSNHLKLQNQDLQRELDACMEDFEMAVEGKKQAEALVSTLQEDIDTAMKDLMALQAERDEALQEHANLENEFQALENEAQEEINALNAEIERLQLDLHDRTENFDALQGEMFKLSDAIVSLEDEQDAKLRKIQQLEQELGDANKELEDLETKLIEANDKVSRLSVQQESSQGEIAFLREEQEGDKIRIGDLEAALANAEQALRDEKERVRELEQRLATERKQREIVANREKEEVQQFVNELNREASAAKDEARKLRKSLTSREVEATEWKERLIELENNLREALGDLNGTRSSLLKSIAKLQRDLENTVRDLEATKASLADKDRIIKQRDALLESHALESRKMAEMLDRERQAHRNVKNQFETFQKTHQHVTRTVNSQDARIMELEASKAQDKRRLSHLETNFKEQLTERNNLLLTMWSRLSALCGTDWAHDNSLINGRALPSLEAVSTMLPGFSKNLLAAVKTIETMVGSFQGKIKSVEKDLWREYQTLESHLDARIKKLDRLEAIVRNGVATGTWSSRNHVELQARLARIEDAYRQLKVENHTLRAVADARTARAAYAGELDPSAAAGSPSPSVPTGPKASQTTAQPSPGTTGGSDNKWMLRLRDLENKLKAEREGRILDRGEAIKRINATEQENVALKENLEKEKRRQGQ